MDIFTIALYVCVIGWVVFMVYKLYQQLRNDWAESKRARRLNTPRQSHYGTKHGQRTGRRK